MGKSATRDALKEQMEAKKIMGLENAHKQAELITDLADHDGFALVLGDIKHRIDHIDEVLKLQTVPEGDGMRRLTEREVDNYYNIRYAFQEVYKVFENARIAKPMVEEKLEKAKKK